MQLKTQLPNDNLQGLRPSLTKAQKHKTFLPLFQEEKPQRWD